MLREVLERVVGEMQVRLGRMVAGNADENFVDAVSFWIQAIADSSIFVPVHNHRRSLPQAEFTLLRRI